MTNEKNHALEIIENFEAQFTKGRNADGGGSKDIIPIVEQFFDTCKRVIVCINERDWQVLKTVTGIAEAGLYAGLNTFVEQEVSSEDCSIVREIFFELEKLLNDYLANARPLTVKIVDGRIEHITETRSATNWDSKVACISQVLYHNQCDARDSVCVPYTASRQECLIWGYKELHEVVKYLNDNWEDLLRRGFDMEVYEAYLESSEADFLEVLKGEKKLIPVYEYKAVGYTTVDATCPDIARIKHHNDRAKPYLLKYSG